MNVFFVIGEEVVTPFPSGTILPGITRNSVITLLHDIGYRVREERIAIDEVLRATSEANFVNALEQVPQRRSRTSGAFVIKDEILELPPIEQRDVGPLVREKLLGIVTGRQPDPHDWVEPI